MQAIPASQVVTVNPGVIDAGGDAFQENGLLLSNSTRVPIGAPQSFPSQLTVASFFGPTSDEANFATTYFAGFDSSTAKPSALLVAQYPSVAVNPFLRGGPVNLTLSQLQAITPSTIALMINGQLHTSTTITLSGATSPSNAATLIQTALAAFDAVVTGSIATTTLTVTAVASGALAIGQVISGTNVTAGTKITAFGTGTGGTGTYTVDTSQTTASTTISAGPAIVTYDSQTLSYVITGGTPGVTGTIGYPAGGSAIASVLNLRAPGGAVLSQGAAATTPTAFMTGILSQTQNWATFTTLFKPTINAMVEFGAWTTAQNNRFGYAMWDTDVANTTPSPTSTALYQIIQNGYAGVIPIYQPAGLMPTDAMAGALEMGFAASLDFARRNGRATFAFKSQAGFIPGVTDAATAAQLLLNGCNFYGQYASAANGFQFFYDGSVTGKFRWSDSFFGQINLNNGLQFAALDLLTNVNSVPYNDDGYGLIESALYSPIKQAIRFGTIRSNVSLTKAQVAEVNAAAGRSIAASLQTVGWYLIVEDPGADVRALRGSPVITLFYTDGGSVQKIVIASIDVM